MFTIFVCVCIYEVEFEYFLLTAVFYMRENYCIVESLLPFVQDIRQDRKFYYFLSPNFTVFK